MISSKWQTTTSLAIRRYLTLKPGDRIQFVVDADGRVVLRPAAVDVRKLYGLLAPAPRYRSFADMDGAIRKRANRC